MRILGIDPGRGGGWAVVEKYFDFEGGLAHWVVCSGAMNYADPVNWARSPWFSDLGGEMAGGGISRHAKCSLLAGVVVEQQEPRPNDSARNGFMTAMNYGALMKLVEAEIAVARGEVPRGFLMCPRPSKWKGDMGLSKDKGASIDLATEIFGEDCARSHWPLKKHHGVAEAALMAVWRLKREVAGG